MIELLVVCAVFILLFSVTEVIEMQQELADTWQEIDDSDYYPLP